MSDPITPADLPSPPDPVSPPRAPLGSAEPPAGPPRRRGLVAGAIALAVTLVAGSLVLVLGRGGSAEARPLALRFVAGESRTYELHQTMDGRVAADLFGEQAMTMEMTQVSTWDVVSVDQDGVATIEVTVIEFSGSMNGIEMPDSAPSVPPIEFRVAPDGRILSAGGFALGGATQTDGFGFPGMGQLTPILPDDGQAVAPGDAWDKEYAQEFPFGEGTIAFTSSNRYERNEEVNGREAAVIVSDISVPLDFTIELDRLLEALGGEMPAGATGLDAVADATLAYEGGGAFSMTSWVDLEAKELLKSESAGDFDIEMRFEGLAGFEGAMTFVGTFSQDLGVREG